MAASLDQPGKDPEEPLLVHEESPNFCSQGCIIYLDMVRSRCGPQCRFGDPGVDNFDLYSHVESSFLWSLIIYSKLLVSVRDPFQGPPWIQNFVDNELHVKAENHHKSLPGGCRSGYLCFAVGQKGFCTTGQGKAERCRVKSLDSMSQLFL